MIIIEGPDCAGKTTLAKQLWSHPRLQELGMEIQHLSLLPVGHDRCWHYVERINRNGIFDRFHYSELAYCEARGDKIRPLTRQKLRFVDGHLDIIGAYKILLTVKSQDILRARWNKDEMYDIDTVYRANVAFKSLPVNWDWMFTARSSTDYLPSNAIESIVAQYCAERKALDEIFKSNRGVPR